MPLKYLFTATFEDGSQIRQTLEDRSELEPEKRSAFYDVLKRAETTPLVSFALTEHERPGTTFSVDLRDGHFEHNGVAFDVSDGLDSNEKGTISAWSHRQIVFWRRHTHEVRVADGAELNHSIRYDLGWQANVGGKNYQRIIHIK